MLNTQTKPVTVAPAPPVSIAIAISLELRKFRCRPQGRRGAWVDGVM